MIMSLFLHTLALIAAMNSRAKYHCNDEMIESQKGLFNIAPQRSHYPEHHRRLVLRRESISSLYFLLTDLSVDSLKRSSKASCP